MKKFLFAAFASLLLHTVPAVGETHDFGGWSERMKGHGDRVPPRCQIDAPRNASSPFFVTWYCPDEDTVEQNVRTEVWIFRKGALAGELVKTFLGFPAAVRIDEGLLKVTNFKDGLPVGIRLTATDQAGNTSMSPTLTVLTKTDSINQCSMTVTQTASESTDSTSGTPESSVKITDVIVTTTQIADNTYTISSAESTVADPCEIDTLCESDKKVEFISELVVGDNSTATGTVIVTPGKLTVSSSSATVTVTDNILKSVELSGSTEFEGRTTTVSLNCNQ